MGRLDRVNPTGCLYRGLASQWHSKVGLLPKTISALDSDPRRSSVASLFKLLSTLDLELVLKPKSKLAALRADQDCMHSSTTTTGWYHR